MTHAPVRVLLVDDSAVVRGAIGSILEKDPDIKVVTTATNGRMALEALRHTPIDVVLLDVEMPEMDGLTALPQILAEHPNTRVIMASSLTQAGATVTLQALSLGAADFITKPTAKGGGAALSALSHEIISKIKAVARAKNAAGPRMLPAAPKATPQGAPAILGSGGPATMPRIIAIASSTGGPNALAEVLSHLTLDTPVPIVITQHMPPLFTALLAQRLAKDSGRPCVEAKDGDTIKPDHMYVAPGDFHMTLATHEGIPFVRLNQGQPENHCRPAADPMMRSVAAIYGAASLGVVLTGMGEDGRNGCQAIRARGGRVIAQDEASSVVWGMPGAVVNAGLANYILPLDKIAGKISALCARRADVA